MDCSMDYLHSTSILRISLKYKSNLRTNSIKILGSREKITIILSTKQGLLLYRVAEFSSSLFKNAYLTHKSYHFPCCYIFVINSIFMGVDQSNKWRCHIFYLTIPLQVEIQVVLVDKLKKRNDVAFTVAIITLRDLVSCSINAQYAFCHLIFKLDECQLCCWSLRYTCKSIIFCRFSSHRCCILYYDG